MCQWMDFKDLFSTLIVSLPLSTHRFRFKTYPFSFASEEAINNLGSLKFSQSNRMPDPKDPSRIVTTTTTTTFSMAKEMARSVCQRFMDARFIELADGKTMPNFPLKGCLWQLTPKGIHILERFCQRNGIQQEHVLRLLNSPFNTMRLVILERDPKTDKLSHDKFTTEVIFRRFAGQTPNIKANISISDNDSVSDYQDGQTGVKLAESRKIYDKVIKMSFTGKCAVDWLLDCCTTVERAETHEICTLFVQFGLIQSVLDDRVYIQQNPTGKDFQPTKNAVYIVTDKGKRVAGWIEAERVSLGDRNGDGNANGTSGRGTSAVRNREDRGHTDQRETNTTRLQSILSDPALRLLYREFLRETVCEENLTFYLDVTEFNKNFNAIDLSKPDAVRETLAAAYGLYNAFLAPGSPCELNIDHPLRQDMASRMTRAVAKDDASMYTSLKEVAALFDRAQQQVFKLMAGDSVPKFIRTHKYLEVAGDILDDERIAAGNGLHRSASRSARYNNNGGDSR
ncbi:regulator of G protein signaling domain-containing protein [Tricharina praecox]|uniref:regulator of G protein signaling domain-containing protein n=1 Tax=Tricharina praecox TaxID=43433 RepID=UPI00221EC129|nr:regulator of G protein signaling domain-containing protein [Tricharina praecox]KAI5848814.1 regulator of G protein signaling domain-containing protein [Tricharina praecox]